MSGAERTQAYLKISGGTQKRASEASKHQRFDSLLAVAHAATQVEARIASSQISGQETTSALEPSSAGRVIQPGQSVKTSAAEPHGLPGPPGPTYSPFSTSLELADTRFADPRFANLAFRSEHAPRSSSVSTPGHSNVLPYLSTRRRTIGAREGASPKSNGEAKAIPSRAIAEPRPSRGTKLQGREGLMPQISRTDGPGSSKGVDDGSSRGTRPPSSRRAQRPARLTSDIDSGIPEPIHQGNPYEHALGRAWVSATENLCRAMRNRNEHMVNMWYERVQTLNLKWNQRSARPLPEPEDLMVRRTGLPPVRHPEIRTLLQVFTHPGKIRRICQLRLQELVARPTDDSPESEELITQYTRLLLNATQTGAEGGVAARHDATEVVVLKKRATGDHDKGPKNQAFLDALQSMSRPEQLLALRNNSKRVGINDHTRSEVLDYLEQNKTAAEVTRLTGVAVVTIYKWKRIIREADKKRTRREASS